MLSTDTVADGREVSAGPFHFQSSTEPTLTSVIRVANVIQHCIVTTFSQCGGKFGSASQARNIPSTRFLGNVFNVTVAESTDDVLYTNRAGDAICCVANERQPASTLAGPTPNFSLTPDSSINSPRRSNCTTRSPTTHCPRSLSGVTMSTWPTRCLRWPLPPDKRIVRQIRSSARPLLPSSRASSMTNLHGEFCGIPEPSL